MSEVYGGTYTNGVPDLPVGTHYARDSGDFKVDLVVGAVYDVAQREALYEDLRSTYEPLVEETAWDDVFAYHVYRVVAPGASEYVDTVAIVLPCEPSCSNPPHLWDAPHELVGGLRENPGVWADGAGVRTHEVCMRCGVHRVTSTAHPDGRGGVREARRYLPPDEETLEFLGLGVAGDR